MCLRRPGGGRLYFYPFGCPRSHHCHHSQGVPTPLLPVTRVTHASWCVGTLANCTGTTDQQPSSNNRMKYLQTVACGAGGSSVGYTKRRGPFVCLQLLPECTTAVAFGGSAPLLSANFKQALSGKVSLQACSASKRARTGPRPAAAGRTRRGRVKFGWLVEEAE